MKRDFYAAEDDGSDLEFDSDLNGEATIKVKIVDYTNSRSIDEVVLRPDAKIKYVCPKIWNIHSIYDKFLVLLFILIHIQGFVCRSD